MRNLLLAWMAPIIVCFSSGPALAVDGFPPAPNVGSPAPECPPSMLGDWRPFHAADRERLGDLRINPDSIKFEHLGRFAVHPTGPPLEGIDWSGAPGSPVTPENLFLSPTPEVLAIDPPITVPDDRIQGNEVLSISYGQEPMQTPCELDILFCRTKRDNAFALGGQLFHSDCTSKVFAPRPPFI